MFQNEIVPFWDEEGYTPHIFKRVWRWFVLLGLEKYRKQECAIDWECRTCGRACLEWNSNRLTFTDHDSKKVTGCQDVFTLR